MRITYEGNDTISILLPENNEILLINPTDERIGKLSETYNTVSLISTNAKHNGHKHVQYLGEETGRLPIGSFIVHYHVEDFGTYILLDHNTQRIFYDAGISDTKAMLADRKNRPSILCAAISLTQGIPSAIELVQKLQPQHTFPIEAQTQNDGIHFAKDVLQS